MVERARRPASGPTYAEREAARKRRNRAIERQALREARLAETLVVVPVHRKDEIRAVARAMCDEHGTGALPTPTAD